MKLEDKLKAMVEASGVSGFESSISDTIKSFFKDLSDETQVDPLGNLIFLKKGNADQPIKIMFAAHMDEIGLMVKDIDEFGFISFTNIGGVDTRTLPAQEVYIHGKKDVYGIIGAKPPHLQDAEDRKKTPKIEDMRIDVGMSKEDVENRISIGDSITIKRNLIPLQTNYFSSKALDDRAGILAMLHCFEILNNLSHKSDVYGVCTVQEEVGTKGAMVSTFEISPDIGIAVDVGFGSTPGLSKDDTISLGKGPGITLGANIHPKIHKRLLEISKEHNIPYQIELSPGNSGTDAQSMQITQAGVATGVISIPLRYMHTSVETINMDDIKNTGKLMAYFISSLDHEDLEEFLCF
ncbi:M42 family metallopeptidase [Lutibacter sp. B2]|nr:M42 family metallopeptidase [Lutibacter sp. B2]